MSEKSSCRREYVEQIHSQDSESSMSCRACSRPLGGIISICNHLSRRQTCREYYIANYIDTDNTNDDDKVNDRDGTKDDDSGGDDGEKNDDNSDSDRSDASENSSIEEESEEEDQKDEENDEGKRKSRKVNDKPSNINNNAVNGDTISNESQHPSSPSTPTSTSSSMVMMMSSSSITPNSHSNGKITSVNGISNGNSSPMQFSTPSSTIGSSKLATTKSGRLLMIPDDLQHSASPNENVVVGPEEDLISKAYLFKDPVQCPKCLRIFRGKTPAVAYNNHRRNRHCPFSSETKRLSLKNRPSTGGSSGSTLKTLTNDSKASSSVNDSLKLVSTLSSSSSSASHKNGSSKHISTAVNSSSTNKSKKIDPSNPNWGRDSVRYFCKICNSNEVTSRVSLTIHLTVSHGIPPVNMNPDLCLPLNLRCQSCSKIFNSKYIYFLHRYECDLDSPYVGIHHLSMKKRGRKPKFSNSSLDHHNNRNRD